jgi:hypothetical protein
MDLTEINLDNEGWITIKKKVKPMSKKKQIKKDRPNKSKCKYIHMKTRLIVKSDWTLTAEERQLIKLEEEKRGKKFGIGCFCCDTNIISDVICRTVVSCGTCYCCAGDDPAFDSEWDRKSVKRRGTFCVYNPKYHYTKDHEFIVY